ncbi:MAG TPA: lysophospholipid acyltransferase family protein [Opitutaceae bacterium]|nr:lysophospholipid acyltransferase family protein [Opitutaceae bacterium]
MTPHSALAEMSSVYAVCHFTVETLHAILFPGEVSGVESIPRTGGLIVAANHASVLDPPLIGCHVPRQLAFFARKTLWKGGLVSWWLDIVGTIPVDRDSGADASAIRRVLKVLRDGRAIIVFPEGTRTRTGALQRPKPGVGLLACRAGVPVVPARIFGTFEALGRTGPLRVGTPISIAFGPPLVPAVFDNHAEGKDRYQHASERIMAAIAALELPRPTVI